ncbi:hypothetical protein XU19_24060, partial [Vibrio parahaemolyticus]
GKAIAFGPGQEIFARVAGAKPPAGPAVAHDAAAPRVAAPAQAPNPNVRSLRRAAPAESV